MRTRTHLTSPPGQDPARSDTASTADEVWVPGLALPDEPRPAGRHRRLRGVLAVLLVLVALGYTAFRIRTAGEGFDPALDPDFAPTDVATTPADSLPGDG